MSYQSSENRPVRVVFRRSKPLTKILALVVLVLCMAVVCVLSALSQQAKARTARLEQQAAELEKENQQLEQYIDDLDTVQGIEYIAREELGLVDPDTVVLEPES